MSYHQSQNSSVRSLGDLWNEDQAAKQSNYSPVRKDQRHVSLRLSDGFASSSVFDGGFRAKKLDEAKASTSASRLYHSKSGYDYDIKKKSSGFIPRKQDTLDTSSKFVKSSAFASIRDDVSDTSSTHSKTSSSNKVPSLLQKKVAVTSSNTNVEPINSSQVISSLSSSNIFQCLICSFGCKTFIDVFKHCSMKEHLDRKKKGMDVLNMSKTDFINHFRCLLCSATFQDFRFFSDHCKSPKHVKKASETNNLDAIPHFMRNSVNMSNIKKPTTNSLENMMKLENKIGDISLKSLDDTASRKRKNHKSSSRDSCSQRKKPCSTETKRVLKQPTKQLAKKSVPSNKHKPKEDKSSITAAISTTISSAQQSPVLVQTGPRAKMKLSGTVNINQCLSCAPTFINPNFKPKTGISTDDFLSRALVGLVLFDKAKAFSSSSGFYLACSKCDIKTDSLSELVTHCSCHKVSSNKPAVSSEPLSASSECPFCDAVISSQEAEVHRQRHLQSSKSKYLTDII